LSSSSSKADLISHSYWRLSGFYLFYFASIGALIPFWGLYLQSLGFDAQQIATVFAVIMGTKIIAPNIWAWIADLTGKRMLIIRLASLCSLLSFLLVFNVDTYSQMLLVMLCFSFFWNANLPQFEAVTLNYLGENTNRYSAIRLWGSLGFVLVVIVLGILFEQLGIQILPIIISGLLLAICISSWLVKEKNKTSHSLDKISLLSVLRNPVVFAFLAVCFLLQASHGPYYAFYSIFLEQQGYARGLIGQLWALGVIAEIVIFLMMHQLLKKFTVRQLLFIALLLTSIRWLLIGHIVDSLFLLVLAQTLHAASFGLFHAVSIHLIHQFFPGAVQGRGQALYSSVSFGAGGAFGAMYCGYTWQNYAPSVSFDIAAVISFLALILTWLFVHNKSTEKR